MHRSQVLCKHEGDKHWGPGLQIGGTLLGHAVQCVLHSWLGGCFSSKSAAGSKWLRRIKSCPTNEGVVKTCGAHRGAAAEGSADRM